MSENSKYETKEQRFKRIASKRTENVLEALRRLGNCSNRGIYGFSNEDINKNTNARSDATEDGIDQVDNVLTNNERRPSVEFGVYKSRNAPKIKVGFYLVQFF